MQAPFIALARVEDISEGQFKAIRHEGRAYILARVGDRFYAVEDNCSHEDYLLSYGCLDGDRIKCSLHGSRFSLKTGEPQDEPADEAIATFATGVEDGQVWIDPTPGSGLDSGQN